MRKTICIKDTDNLKVYNMKNSCFDCEHLQRCLKINKKMKEMKTGRYNRVFHRPDNDTLYRSQDWAVIVALYVELTEEEEKEVVVESYEENGTSRDYEGFPAENALVEDIDTSPAEDPVKFDSSGNI